jgi:hypothetical protein
MLQIYLFFRAIGNLTGIDSHTIDLVKIYCTTGNSFLYYSFGDVVALFWDVVAQWRGCVGSVGG